MLMDPHGIRIIPTNELGTAQENAVARQNVGIPYFRKVHATFLGGEFSVDPSYVREMEKPTSDAMSFWVGGGAFYVNCGLKPT